MRLSALHDGSSDDHDDFTSSRWRHHSRARASAEAVRVRSRNSVSSDALCTSALPEYVISASTNAKSAEPVACSGESGGLCRQKIQAPSSAAMLLVGKSHSPVMHAHPRCVSLHPEAVAEAVDAAASHITQRKAVLDPRGPLRNEDRVAGRV